MGRAVLVLTSRSERNKAKDWIERAPSGTRVTFQASKRTLPQNARFWSMLTYIASQCDWHGLKLHANDWKLIFLDALKRELRVVPNLDGNGFVSLGRSSSELSKSEMADCMELIAAWAAQKGIVFSWEGKDEQDIDKPV
jgi:hypothetical protein